MDRKIFAHELKRAGHKSSLSLLVVRYYPSEMELRSVEKIKVMVNWILHIVIVWVLGLSSPCFGMSMEPSLKAHLEEEWFGLERLRQSFDAIRASPLYKRTPVLADCADVLGLDAGVCLNLKMESMQTSGSYKLRGVIWQMERYRALFNSPGRLQGMVTMSSGNYGIALATYCKHYNIPCHVIVPDECPPKKCTRMVDLRASVEVAHSSQAADTIDRLQAQNWTFMHPFDDLNLVCGYGTIMMELVDSVGQPDVVVVPAGPVVGGGLLCGMALAARLMELPTKVFGVDVVPESRRRDSLPGGEMRGFPEKYIGDNAFRIGFDCVDGMVTVNERDVLDASNCLLQMGIVLEPYAASTVAALLSGKLAVEAGQKIVSIVSSRDVDL
ncbi:pyridoxal-phosphate dependent protein [Trichinella nativa]|uniref:L-serine deaminase n=1 Tax=Trichinella nativa TaxID=6335 RepID=A0A1Y3ETK1_9BILA|nr:pyridoxal-phosphate dependent protein [Trichinella nativa]